MFVVTVDISHTHHHRKRTGRFTSLMGHNDRTLAEGELGTVIPDPQSFYESKRAAEPLNRLAHIGVGKFRDNYARWHGTVHIHGYTSSYLIQKSIWKYMGTYVLCQMFLG